MSVAVAGSLLVTGPSADASTPAETLAANRVYTLLNAERAANRLPALAWSPPLVNSAHAHNVAMGRANVLSHQLPGERALGDRIRATGVNWHFAAENIGWTSNFTAAGATGMQQAMYNEKAPNDGHRQNILSRSAKYVGIDVTIGQDGKMWLTEDFADAGGAMSLAARNPVGHYDSATTLPGHKVRLGGWAVDPDNRSQPLSIAVYYDGRGIAWFPSGVARPDVARIVGTGPNQGFNITVALPPGKHSVCTFAINVGAGTGNPGLGCRSVTT